MHQTSDYYHKKKIVKRNICKKKKEWLYASIIMIKRSNQHWKWDYIENESVFFSIQSYVTHAWKMIYIIKCLLSGTKQCNDGFWFIFIIIYYYKYTSLKSFLRILNIYMKYQSLYLFNFWSNMSIIFIIFNSCNKKVTW